MKYIVLTQDKTFTIQAADKFSARTFLLKKEVVKEGDNFIIFKTGEIPEGITLDIYNRTRNLFPENTRDVLWLLHDLKNIF